MSYCVNCGVELAQEIKACPLCNVVVINPAAKQDDAQTAAFAQTKDAYRKPNRLFWIKFNSIIASVPIAICLLCNLLFDHALSWSLIVLAGVLMLFVVCTSPFFFKRFGSIKMMLTDFAAIAAGLGFMQLLLPQRPWFFFIALPIALFCLLFWLTAVVLIKRKKLNGLRIVAAFFIFATLLTVLIEMLLGIYNGNAVNLVWSWFVAAPCLSIVALLMLLDNNKQVKQEFAKRFHF